MVFNDGNVPVEKRGGDRKSYKSAEKKNSVRDFIRKLQGRESHYGRNKSRRIYLDPSLSIAKLHKMYQSSVSDQYKVKFPMFYKIFVKEFNISFSTPAIDVCSTCTQLRNKIMSSEDGRMKQQLMTEMRLHKLRASAFYNLLRETREVGDSTSFCFDLQQVQPLPKTPIQQAYYSRQIGFYCFCCVPLDCRNPTFYTWSEEQAGRGSNEIGSAILDYLKNLQYEGKQPKKITMFCDGCTGQNKNNHLLHALLYWLTNKSPRHISELEVIFPVRGHSFLPADRIFGRTEKILRKKEVIVTREEYNELYEQVGIVKRFGKD